MTISNWRPSTNGGKRKGTFSVTMPSGITLIDCSLVEGEKGLFIGMPQKSYQKDGQTKYVAVVKIEDRAISEKFNVQVIQALRDGGHIGNGKSDSSW